MLKILRRSFIIASLGILAAGVYLSLLSFREENRPVNWRLTLGSTVMAYLYYIIFITAILFVCQLLFSLIKGITKLRDYIFLKIAYYILLTVLVYICTSIVGSTESPDYHTGTIVLISALFLFDILFNTEFEEENKLGE